MKKLLGISIVAVLAVAPLMANADTVSVTLQGTNGVVAASNDVASTSYVKGAYNVLGEAINSLGTTVGDSTNGLVKDVADLKSGTGIAAGSITKTQLESTVQTSLGLADSALQKADITTGSENGTIAVEGTDVAVKGLGSAAFADTTAFDDAGAAAGVKSDIEGKLDDGVNGYDIDANSLKVQGANVLTTGSSLDGSKITAGTVGTTQLSSEVQTALTNAGTALQESDIADLESTVSGHTTSIGTNATAITNITNGTTVVGKAAADGDGNVIKTTYATKTELSTAEAAAKTYADQKLVTVHTTWGTDSETAPANVIVNPTSQQGSQS